jgi:hypothetical protein
MQLFGLATVIALFAIACTGAASPTPTLEPTTSVAPTSSPSASAAPPVATASSSVAPTSAPSIRPGSSLILEPTPGTEPASAQPASTPPAAVDACPRSGVAASSTGWGAAAGSRGAEVTVTNAGSSPCVLPSTPGVAVFDAAGNIVLQSPPRPVGQPRTLGVGESIGFSLLFANWCDQSVALPVQLGVVLVGEAAPIQGLPGQTIDDLPPCNGPGQPAEITTTEWEAR